MTSRSMFPVPLLGGQRLPVQVCPTYNEPQPKVDSLHFDLISLFATNNDEKKEGNYPANHSHSTALLPDTEKHFEILDN